MFLGLGQTICGPVPKCEKCPLKSYCGYAREIASSGGNIHSDSNGNNNSNSNSSKAKKVKISVDKEPCPWTTIT